MNALSSKLAHVADRRLMYWACKFSRWLIFLLEILFVLSLLLAWPSGVRAWLFAVLLLTFFSGPCVACIIKIITGRSFFCWREYLSRAVLHVGLTGYELLYPVRRLLYDHFYCFTQSLAWKDRMGYALDWEKPRDINEKIQWLMCKGDTSEWTRLADKHAVREYVASKGLSSILMKEYACVDNPSSLDFESFPQKFVLKCTHDCGSTMILDKEIGFDEKTVLNRLSSSLARRPGYEHGELFYNAIPPRIIAEEALESDNPDFSRSVIDYKVWCFSGKPFSIMTIHDRTPYGAKLDSFDLDWNVHPEWCIFSDHFMNGNGAVPRPACLEQMLSAATVLSEGFPQVRVDFYVAKGRLYFGEMTFSSNFGMMDYFTPEHLRQMGEHCTI